MAEARANTLRLRRRSWLQGLALGSAWALSATLAPSVRAGAQLEEPLSESVRTALSAAIAGAAPPEPVLGSAAERQAYTHWLASCSAILVRWLPQTAERQEFLQTLWYEARRAGLPLSLVLGVVQIESAFRKYAISSAGARGYMQVMPFWARTIGDGDASKLFHLQTNLRFGCVILGHLLERERGDVFMGLGRYNGSRGQSAYPQAVLQCQRQWLQSVD